MCSGVVAPAVLTVATLLPSTDPGLITWPNVIIMYMVSQGLFWLAMSMTRFLKRQSAILIRLPSIVIFALITAILICALDWAMAASDGKGKVLEDTLRDAAILFMAGAVSYSVYIAILWRTLRFWKASGA